MTQQGLALDLSTEHTRRREFLEEMRRVAPRSTLIALIEPHYPKGKTERPPFPVATMLQIHPLPISSLRGYLHARDSGHRSWTAPGR